MQLRSQTKDLTGLLFGDLLVFAFAGYFHDDFGEARAFWWVICRCGEVLKVRASPLIQKKARGCTQCGIKRGSLLRTRPCGEIGRRYWYSIKGAAKRRNIEFDITMEYAWELFLSQNRKCKFSGEDICFGINRTASLDRINSYEGYYEGNVQWVSMSVNFMKRSMKDEEFIAWCCKIADCQRKNA